MNKLKKCNVYKAANVMLDADRMHGTSYSWYWLVHNFNGVVVLNTYRYSVTTAKHVSKVRSLLRELGVNYLTLESPEGLQNLGSAIDLYLRRIQELEQAMAKKGARKDKNQERLAEIQEYREKLDFISQLENSKLGKLYQIK
jgi:hypothetical protein